VGSFRKVRLSNITAKNTSPVGCSITGLPGHPIEDVVLEDVRLGFDGGGTVQDTQRAIPEREDAYPESTMFGTLPAYGFFCRHARGLTFSNVTLSTTAPDLRHAVLADDAENMTLDHFQAQFSPGAAPQFRMVQVRGATIRNCAPELPAGTFLRLEGETTRGISLLENDLRHVGTIVDVAPDVPKGACMADKKPVSE
jgi:hypothetical protein